MRSSPRPTLRALLPAVLAMGAACGPSRTPPADGPEPADEVVTGYGSEPRATSTASTATLTREEIAGQGAVRLQELLERLPGVDVARDGRGGYSVRIRGTKSMMGNNEPLFVVDGVPRAYGYDGALDAIAPSSIHRIDVLRDAATLAMYGSRGANGVIVITTVDHR